jgi:hypothetical protein
VTVAGSVGEAKHYFLARSGRSSCAPRPGPRALHGMGFTAFSPEFWAVSLCFPSQLRGRAGLGAALWESFLFLELGAGLAPGAVRALVLALKTQIPVMFLYDAEVLLKVAPFATGGLPGEPLAPSFTPPPPPDPLCPTIFLRPQRSATPLEAGAPL